MIMWLGGGGGGGGGPKKKKSKYYSMYTVGKYSGRDRAIYRVLIVFFTLKVFFLLLLSFLVLKMIEANRFVNSEHALHIKLVLSSNSINSRSRPEYLQCCEMFVWLTILRENQIFLDEGKRNEITK